MKENEVHIWIAHLDFDDSRIDDFVKTLSGEERERSHRFRRERDRRYFIAARGQLREIIGRYLELPPAAIAFSYSPTGKPELSDTENCLKFNLSHSHNLALYGICRDRAIGIDLEYLRPLPDANQLARRFFSPREWQALNALPESQQHRAFFQAWTRKEAYLKATGMGLAGLSGVEVTIAPEAPPQLIAIEGDNPAAWTLCDLQPHPDYTAALAIATKSPQLRYFKIGAEDLIELTHG